jgi:hypothetical protein
MTKNAKQHYSILSNEDPETGNIQGESFDVENTTVQGSSYTEEKKNNDILIEEVSIKSKFLDILRSAIFKLIFGSLLSIHSVYYYLVSLEGCKKDQAECLKEQTFSTAMIVGSHILYSSISYFILTVSVLFEITYQGFLFFMTGIYFYLFYFYDTGADFANHGSYNRIFFYLFFISLSIVIGGLILLFYTFRKHVIKLILIMTILVFLLYKYFQDYVEKSCEGWDKGMRESKINNQYGHCKIIPLWTKCFLTYTDGLFDMARLKGDCRHSRDVNEERSLLLKWVPEDKRNALRLGYPRTEYWNFFPDCTLSLYNKNIFKNMIDMDKASPETIKDVEVVVDLSQNEPEVKITLKKNQTLIDERQAIHSQYKDNLPFKNIIQIYIDAFSRNHFRRKFKKVFEWLEEFYESNWTQYSSYQFFKYHAVDYYTYANMIPAYFGVHKWEKYNMPYFLWEYKKRGYIVGQSSNVCEKEGWDLENVFKDYLNYTNFDHELNPFFCDPNFSDPDQPYQVFKGAYSVFRKCMYGKDSGDYSIDYAQQFFTTYKDQAKYFRMMFSDAHEGSMEVVKYLDEPVLNFLKFLRENGHLENSVLMIMSDHGTTMPGPAYVSQASDWYSEVFLPTLFFVIPKNHPKYHDYNLNLKSNENIMITGFDIHSTLLNFVDHNQTSSTYGSSLFSNSINDYWRTCNYYQINSAYCICQWQV